MEGEVGIIYLVMCFYVVVLQERLDLVESNISKKLEKREENILKRKRGNDYIEPEVKVDKTSTKAAGKPITGGLASGKPAPKYDNSAAKKEKLRAAAGSQDGAKGKSRAGFEGKKNDFINKKK